MKINATIGSETHYMMNKGKFKPRGSFQEFSLALSLQVLFIPTVTINWQEHEVDRKMQNGIKAVFKVDRTCYRIQIL
jgi:hypothetical protein